MMNTKKIFIFVISIALTALAGYTNAGVIAVDSNTYQVSYDFNVSGFTRSSGDVQDVFIFEWNDTGDINVDFAYTLDGGTTTNITRTLNFAPTAAFVIGYTLGQAGLGDEVDHIFTFTNREFAYSVVGFYWREAFPDLIDGSRVRHSEMIQLLASAALGDGDALARLTDFVRYEAYDASFNPSGRNVALEWSLSTVPAPATVMLMGIGLAGLGWSRRKKV